MSGRPSRRDHHAERRLHGRHRVWHGLAGTVAAAGHEVTGYDVSEKMVGLAGARGPAARFEVADMRTLDFEGATRDAVLAFFSMLQLTRAEQDSTITKLAQWRTPGGYLAFATVPGDADGVAAEWMGHWAGLLIVREDLVQFTPSDPLASPKPQPYLTARKPPGD